MDWFYVALLSPALFAVVNILDDNLLRSVYRTPFFGAIVSGLFSLLPLISLFFVTITIPPLPILLLCLLIGFLTVSYYLFYFKGLSLDAPSIVISLFNMSPAFVPFLAYVFLHETLEVNEYIGFIVILLASVGISVIEIKKLKFSPALYPIAFASFMYAIIAILQKYIYSFVDFWSGYIFISIGLGLGAIFYMVFFKEGRAFPKEFKRIFKKWIFIFVIVELIGISAELSINYAISQGPVSLVKVIEGIQPMYVLLFAILFFPFFPKYFREATHGNIAKKIFFMGLMLVGLYFVNS